MGIYALISLLECRCPSGCGPPGSNPLADMDPQSKSESGYGPPPSADLDPPTKLSENIILNVLVKMDDNLRSSAY